MYGHDRQATRVLRVAVSQPTDWVTKFHVKGTEPLGEGREYKCSPFGHDTEFAAAKEQYRLLF
jgi:hypothetical protein